MKLKFVKISYKVLLNNPTKKWRICQVGCFFPPSQRKKRLHKCNNLPDAALQPSAAAIGGKNAPADRNRKNKWSRPPFKTGKAAVFGTIFA